MIIDGIVKGPYKYNAVSKVRFGRSRYKKKKRRSKKKRNRRKRSRRTKGSRKSFGSRRRRFSKRKTPDFLRFRKPQTLSTPNKYLPVKKKKQRNLLAERDQAKLNELRNERIGKGAFVREVKYVKKKKKGTNLEPLMEYMSEVYLANPQAQKDEYQKAYNKIIKTNYDEGSPMNTHSDEISELLASYSSQLKNYKLSNKETRRSVKRLSEQLDDELRSSKNQKIQGIQPFAKNLVALTQDQGLPSTYRTRTAELDHYLKSDEFVDPEYEDYMKWKERESKDDYKNYVKWRRKTDHKRRKKKRSESSSSDMSYDSQGRPRSESSSSDDDDNDDDIDSFFLKRKRKRKSDTVASLDSESSKHRKKFLSKRKYKYTPLDREKIKKNLRMQMRNKGASSSSDDSDGSSVSNEYENLSSGEIIDKYSTGKSTIDSKPAWA